MRNYVIINGINSNTINGLAINEMPPITKPSIRTNTEEIDGRDGDIVTKLGYSAYTKEFTIGLYGDFDIDEVIAFFNSEGTVVFSNEDDKYYNYQILDQIDFEKLIRFKTAKIKMHVQPFKYPIEETPVEITNQYVNNEAEEMDLDNTKEAPMTIALKGNTSQERTPTPDAPVEVETTTGDNTINIVGKNLFDKDNANVINGYLSWNGKISGSGSDRIVYIPCKPNTTYSLQKMLQGTTSKNRFRVGTTQVTPVLDMIVDDYLNLKDGSSATSTMITTGTNAKYLLFHCYASDTVTTFEEMLDSIQIELGSQATTCEPYQSQSYPINLGDIELCKIGDYQDRIYKDSGKWYIEKKIGKLVLDGSEDWSIWRTNTFYFNFNEALANEMCYCSHFIKVNQTQLLTNGIAFVQATNKVQINIYPKQDFIDNYGTLEGFKNWLGTHNIIVYYVLATPTTTEITDTTLISQLNALAGAESYSGQTNISQTNDDKPFILNATALQQGSGEATVNNEGNIYSKPTLDIEGSGTVGIYLDGNQIFSIDLSNSSECVIDTTQLEAYNPTTSELMNRQVTGDYSNFKLNAGDNQVQATGEITKVTISNYTRWL